MSQYPHSLRVGFQIGFAAEQEMNNDLMINGACHNRWEFMVQGWLSHGKDRHPVYRIDKGEYVDIGLNKLAFRVGF